jgi:hypothetical protein
LAAQHGPNACPVLICQWKVKLKEPFMHGLNLEIDCLHSHFSSPQLQRLLQYFDPHEEIFAF